jgi:predicted protein tyrosine phosphatase
LERKELTVLKIEIHGFESIQLRAKTPFEPRTSLISIGDPDAPFPELEHRPDHILRLVFDDVSLEDAKEMLPDLPSTIEDDNEKRIALLEKYDTFIFNDKMARKIAEFVFKYNSETDILICQCEYGQSRSAGCAAAVAEHLYGNGVAIFSDNRYYPNKLVYRKVLEALRDYEENRPVHRMDYA